MKTQTTPIFTINSMYNWLQWNFRLNVELLYENQECGSTLPGEFRWLSTPEECARAVFANDFLGSSFMWSESKCRVCNETGGGNASDTWNIYSVYSSDNYMDAYSIDAYRARVIKSLEPGFSQFSAHGVFVDACSAHCETR